jgi:hypothetical protein|tara:strand:+ start:921 stop:1748 length:828 start_codon:yes stop_codon:yes gene_type:complete
MSNIRTILITGKIGTGKSTKAKTFVENPIVLYANDIDFDVGAFPVENGIIIEDVHYKPDKSAILDIIRKYKGQVVLTSINQKSVPKEIFSMCKVKRAGSNNYLKEQIKELAPHSVSPVTWERDTYSLVYDYLKETDRELVRNLLLFNKPSDTQIISWLAENMHPNRLIFVDGVVKRRWSQRYFYEMLAYAHEGNLVGRLNMPTRRKYSKVPSLSRRLKVKNPDVLKQLLMDEDFKEWAKKKLNNAECRILKIGEKRRRKKTTPIEVNQSSLEDFI